MAYPATGSPVQAFVDGLRTLLTGDATLMALITGVHGHVPEGSRQDYPFVVLGRRSATGDIGAMQVAGNRIAIQVDVFHGRNPDAATNVIGPGPVHAILSRISVLLERQAVTVTGYTLIVGSVTREFEEVFDEPDEDAPEQRVYHGVARWAAEVHES